MRPAAAGNHVAGQKLLQVFLDGGILQAPSLIEHAPARDTMSRPPNQVWVPSVRITGSQAAWLSVVPSPRGRRR